MYCEHCEDGWVEVEGLRFECQVCYARSGQRETFDEEVLT